MAILEVLKFPDPRLRKLSQPVSEVTAEVTQFADDLLDTMYACRGIGLSAPQVDRLIRVLVTDTRPPEQQNPIDEPSASPDLGGSSDSDSDSDSDSEEAPRYSITSQTDLEKTVEQPLTIINPVIVNKEGKTTYDEGCLSVPSYYETVERYEYIEVEGLDKNGKPIKVKTDGLLAICIQHEIDHLDGKLFIDRLSTIKANKIKNKIKKFGYPDPAADTDSSQDS